MNSFDEECVVQDIRKLLLERLLERTPDQIRRKARELCIRYQIPLEDAYDELEEKLLRNKPFKEDWELE